MYKTAHQVQVSAPAEKVFGLIENTDQWPQVFPPIVVTERLESRDGWQRARIHLWNDGKAAEWVALRRPVPEDLRLDYRQEQPWPPVLDMGGSWVVQPVDDATCVVHLEHDYESARTDAETLNLIDDIIDNNSEAELAALKAAAELDSELLVTFGESLDIKAPPEQVYRFLRDVEDWPVRIPHVATATLTPVASNVDLLDMDTRTDEGTIHTARSIRVCLPERRIVQKYLVLPPIAALHMAEWAVDDGKATVTHTVVVKDKRSREFAKNALLDNSRLTLAVAKAMVEAGPE
jgi:aromatase